MPFGGLGFGELVLIFAVLLLLFGAKRLPELASGMGRGIRDFKRAVNGMDETSITGAQPTNTIQAPQAQNTVQSAVPAPAQVEAPAEAKQDG
jgi:sec-independent protein translocase protein TatA